MFFTFNLFTAKFLTLNKLYLCSFKAFSLYLKGAFQKERYTSQDLR